MSLKYALLKRYGIIQQNYLVVNFQKLKRSIHFASKHIFFL